MKLAKYLFVLWVLILAAPACSSAEKAAHERKNLMMPHQSEMKRNNKYKPTKSKKTYGYQKKTKKKKRS